MTQVVRRHAPGALVAAMTVWLTLHYAGYHPRQWAFVGVLLAVWTAIEIVRGRMPHPSSTAGLGLLLGVGLTLWTALSIMWADYSRHLAWEEAGRTLVYVLAFAVGAAVFAQARAYVRGVNWIAWSQLAVLTFVASRIAFDDNPLTMFVEGRLDWPVGYANGTFALCAVTAWMLIGISASIEQRHKVGDPPIITAATSALALGGATLVSCLAVMTQSRGGIVATFVAVVISLAVFGRPGALAWRLAVVLAATLVVAPKLSHAYTAQKKLLEAEWVTRGVGRATTNAVEATHQAGITALIAGAGVTLLILAMTLVLVEMRLQRPHPMTHKSPVPLAALAGALILVAVAGAVAEGSAVDWTKDQWAACKDPGDEQERRARFAKQTSHLSAIGTNRCDFYRVELDNFRENPVFGVGANNFQGEYVKKRRSYESPRQAHSLPLQFLGELGLVGFLLGAAVIATIVAAALTFIRSGPLRDPAFAGSIVALAQWGIHTSIDWLWNLPAITLPLALLAGGLVACVSPVQEFVRRAAVIPVTAGLILIAAATLFPLGVGDHLLRSSKDPNRDPQDALEAAEQAERIDPFWAQPPLQQARLLAANKNPEDAADAARRAANAEPGNWSVLWEASLYLAKLDPAEAKKLRASALTLNPRARGEKDPLADPNADNPKTQSGGTQRPSTAAGARS